MFIMVSRREWGDGDSFLTINVVCRYTLLNFCEGEKKLGGGLKNAMYKKKKKVNNYENWHSLERGNDRGECEINPSFLIERNKEIQ